MLASITPFVSLSAFVLLLLVSLSVPIIKSLFLFRLTADATNLYGVADANGSATFGVWGYCVSATDISIAAITQTSTSAECTDPKLGYTFDSTIAEALNVEQYADLINKGSAAALVLHPIACGLAFLTFLSSLFILCCGTGRMPSLCTLGIGLVATILTTIAFLIDVIVVAIIRYRVNDETDGQLQLTWGQRGVDGLGRDGRALAWNRWFMLWHMCLWRTPTQGRKLLSTRSHLSDCKCFF